MGHDDIRRMSRRIGAEGGFISVVTHFHWCSRWSLTHTCEQLTAMITKGHWVWVWVWASSWDQCHFIHSVHANTGLCCMCLCSVQVDCFVGRFFLRWTFHIVLFWRSLIMICSYGFKGQNFTLFPPTFPLFHQLKFTLTTCGHFRVNLILRLFGQCEETGVGEEHPRTDRGKINSTQEERTRDRTS